MKKHIITLLAIIALITAPALASVWTAVSSGGGGGNCYLITFNTASYGQKQRISTGTVSGSTFTGVTIANHTTGNPPTTTCGNNGDCAWWGDTSYYSIGGYGINLVSGLPIVSAQPIACF